MKLADLLKGIPVVEWHADPETQIDGISYDSRRTSRGDLFVAIRGFESDGHKFIGDAVKNGAACVLCERRPGADVPFVLVEDTRRALAEVSSTWFGNPASRLKLVGVTGTNGKTTTTHLIRTIIEKCTGEKVGLIGTNSVEYGDVVRDADHTTPESYELQKLLREMVDAGCAYAVMEVSSHALALSRVHGLVFDVGVFTNLTHEHLDFHGTMEEYARAKSLIFKQSRRGVVNLDDAYAGFMRGAAECPVTTFSAQDDSADLVAKRIRLFADRVEFCALTLERIQKLELKIPGMFSVYNALAAVAAGLELGFELDRIAEALKACSGVKGRMEVVPGTGDFTVVIDYAHKPFALENVIRTFKEIAQGQRRIVTLFGCGGDRDLSKRPMMGEIAARLSDFVIVTTDNPRTEDPSKIISEILEGMKGTKTPYVVIEDRREAIGWAIKNARPKDIIILAGKGHETYQIVGKQKYPFDEREIVREFFSERKSGEDERERG